MGGLFGGGKTVVQAPPIPDPPRMPDPESPSAIAAKRRKAAQMAARGGRESTILTESNSGKLGG